MLYDTECHTQKDKNRAICSCDGKQLTPSLPQPVKYPEAPANGIYSGPITSTFNAVSFDETPQCVSHANAKKKTKRPKGFKCRVCIGRFQVTPWQ